MNGLWLLVRARLRRDRWHLVAWIAAIPGLWGLSALGVGAGFSTDDLRGLVQLIASNPALLMVRGAPTGDTLDAAIMVSLFSYLGVLAGLQATFLAVRHTRGDEDAGRAELVGAAPVSRLAPLVATWIAGLIELGLIAALLWAVASAVGGQPGRSALLALAILGVSLTFLVVGTLAALAMPTSRSANGLAAGVVLVAFMLRGIGDASGTLDASGVHVAPGLATWFSPIGWGALAHPYATEPWRPDATPLLLFPAAIVVFGAVSFAVAARHEIGASLVPERRGRATGSPLLGSPLGLTVRHQLGVTAGWLLATVFMSAAVGRMVPTIASTASDNPMVQLIVQLLGRTDGSADIVDVFLFAFAGIVAIIASAAGMQVVLHAKSEEEERGDTLFATPVPRAAWLASAMIVGAVTGLLVLGVFLVVAQASAATAGTDKWASLAAIVASLAPAIVAWVAIAALLVAVVPRIASPLSWVLLLGLMLIGEFGQLFGPDWDWVQNASPFHWLANPLEAAPDWGPTWWMLAGAAVAIVVALVWFRRRDARLA